MPQPRGFGFQPKSGVWFLVGGQEGLVARYQIKLRTGQANMWSCTKPGRVRQLAGRPFRWQLVLVKILITFALAALALQSGCVLPTRPLQGVEPALYLSETVQRETTRRIDPTATIQHGTFRPVFTGEDGVFYEPERPIIFYRPDRDIVLFVGRDGRHGIYKVGLATVLYFKEPLPLEQR
jgi:hypothetical protein